MYRTPLRYIKGRKHLETTATRQNKTKSHTLLLYNFTNLALALHVGLTKVRASPGAVECFRSPLDPPCHLPTFFAAVIQSRPSLKTTSNATHFRRLPLRGTAPKASIFFWRQSTHDVAGRPPRSGPCTASRPNMTRFESLESPCRTRAPANPSWRFRTVVSMRSEPVLSRTSLYDGGLYPMRSLRRKPIMRKSSLWWSVRRLLKSWERIVHVAHPYSIASNTFLNSLILSDSRAFRRSYNWELYFLTLAQAAPIRRLISMSRSALSLIAPQRYTKSVVCLYRCHAASIRSAFDAVWGWDHRCMASVFFSDTVSPNSWHVTTITPIILVSPRGDVDTTPRIVCIQHPPHRSPGHFQRPLLPGSAILTLRRIIEVHQVRNDQRVLREPLQDHYDDRRKKHIEQ